MVCVSEDLKIDEFMDFGFRGSKRVQSVGCVHADDICYCLARSFVY